MAEKIEPKARNINQIVEHWLPWQDSEADTVRPKTSGPSKASTS